MKKIYDVAIIGGGVSGAFAALRLTEKYKNKKIILFELGRPPQKRRRFLEGWFGCFPTGDGKIYTNDIDKLSNIIDGRKSKSINKWVFQQLNEVNPSKIIKNKKPDNIILSKIKKNGFNFETHDFVQWKPDSIHQLSKQIADKIENNNNLQFSFDNEVYEFYKRNNEFVIYTSDGEYVCKKIILCVGRSGWRWVNKIYRDFGILQSDDIAKYGIKIEISGQYMKNFNKSHCSFYNDELIVGPFSWGGSIIQEDHADLTTAAFRSNEKRWKTDKVFFSLIGLKEFKENGCKQTDRLGKLGFLLAGDRVGREKLKLFMKDNSQLNLIPEYNWLKIKIEELSDIIPTIISRGYFHYPDIIPMMANIKLSNSLETEIDGLFVAGESAGFQGLAIAAITGAIAAESVCK